MTGLLKEPEAAEYLRVRPPTIRKWRRAGLLPFAKLGACVRYRLEDLDAFIAASLRPNPKPPDQIPDSGTQTSIQDKEMIQ